MTEIRLEVIPWQTPNFVIAASAPGKRQDGWTEGPKWPLNAVDAAVLSELCDKFRAEVFLKAGKSDPGVAPTVCSLCDMFLINGGGGSDEPSRGGSTSAKPGRAAQ